MMEHLDDIKKVNYQKTPHRSVSPRLNQLLKLFQSKAQDLKPTTQLSKNERTTWLTGRNFVEKTREKNENDGTAGFKTSQCLGYPSYNSSLKKCIYLDTKIGPVSCIADKPGQAVYSHSRTPYTRDTPSRKYTLSRQKSFKKNRDMDVIRKQQSYKQNNSSREQLESVNILLKGSSRSTSQESKDQGYGTDTSTKSIDERNFHSEFKVYYEKVSKPSLDAIMKTKLSLSEEDDCSREYDERNSRPFEISDSLNDERYRVSNVSNYEDNQPANNSEEQVVSSQIITESGKGGNNVFDNPVKCLTENSKTEKLSSDVSTIETDGFSDSFRGRSLTDSTHKNKKRKPLTRSRSAVIFKPPRRLCVSETDEGIQLDENGFLQIVNDIKSMKTCLLKLKRELQEAPVVSPLSTLCAGSQRFFDDSFVTSSCTSPSESRGPESSKGPRKLIRRTTVDSCSLRRITKDASDLERERLLDRYSSFQEGEKCTQTASWRENYEGELPSVEKLQAMFESKKSLEGEETPRNENDDKREKEQLRKELADINSELEQVKQERNCFMIVREELEHELDSKNYTIKLLQKQLEGQDCRNEVQSLQKQVKALMAQLEEQKDKIYNLVHDGELSPTQTNSNSRSKSYWSELRIKLKDAVVTCDTASPNQAVVHLPSRTTPDRRISQPRTTIMKKSEQE